MSKVGVSFSENMRIEIWNISKSTTFKIRSLYMGFACKNLK